MRMTWKEFYDLAVPKEIRIRESQKNRYVSWSRWVNSRYSYVLFHLGVTGNMISVLRALIVIFSLYFLSFLMEGQIGLPLIGVALMALQLNLDGVDGNLARAQGKASDFGTCLDNIAIDYARMGIWVLFAIMTENIVLILMSVMAGYFLVPFKQYLGIVTSDTVDKYVRYFIYVPISLVIIPLTIIFLVYIGFPLRAVSYFVTLLYVSLSIIWFCICLWKNLIKNSR